MMGTIFQRLLIFVICIIPHLGFAEQDLVEQSLQRQYDVPLRWDNVEGSPAWVAGQEPGYEGGMHTVRLEPGQFVIVRIPSLERLRILHADAPLSVGDVEVALSKGTGLYAYVPVQTSGDGKSVLVSPESSHPMLAKVSRSVKHDSAIDIALFTSRHEPLNSIAPYRGTVSLSTDTGSIRRWDQNASVKFWRLKPYAPVSVSVHGPARYALESRFIFPETETSLLQHYYVHAHLDDQLLRLLEFETSADTTSGFTVDWGRAVMGRLEVGYIDIPDGDHELTLRSSVDLYLRLLEQEDTDYLFTDLNSPDPRAAEVQKNLAQSAPVKPSLSLNRKEIRAIATSPDSNTLELERVGMRLARDNSHRGGALAGSMLMLNASKSDPANTSLRRSADGLLLRHTFHRKLLPVNKPNIENGEYYLFVPYRLREPQGREEPLEIVGQLHRNQMGGISEGYFIPLPEPGDDAKKVAMRYILPSRLAPSLLRVTVASGELARAQNFMVQYDDQAPIHMQVEPKATVDLDEFAPSRGEAVLNSIGDQYGRSEASTLSGPFSVYNRVPGRLIEAASIDLPLPPDVRVIKLMKAGAGEGLRVALQYRASATSRLSETAYMRAMKNMGSDQDVFQHFVETVAFGGISANKPRLLIKQESTARFFVQVGAYSDPQNANSVRKKLEQAGYHVVTKDIHKTDGSVTRILAGPYTKGSEAIQKRLHIKKLGFDAIVVEDEILHADKKEKESISLQEIARLELANDWFPLARMLQVNNNTFSASVPVSAAILKKGKPLSAARIKSLTKRARKAEADKQWVLALDYWSKVAVSSSGEQHREAQLKRIIVLGNLGETFLADRTLRAIYLFSPDARLKQQAFNLLLDNYSRIGDYRPILALVTTQALRSKKPEMFAAVARLLQENGEYRMALKVNMALPPEFRSNVALMKSAYKLGWWKTYEQLLPALSEEERNLWIGYRAQLNGDYSKASVSWRKAGKDGEALAASLADALSIRARLQSRDESNRKAAIPQWMNWWGEYPGPRTWKEEANLIVDSDGTKLVHNVERELYFYGYRGTASRPVKLLVPGSTRVRISVRPIHENGKNSSRNGWVQIREANSLRLLPFFNNVKSSFFDIEGERSKLGRSVRGDYSFGPGLHEVEISGGNVPILVRVYAERSDFPLSVLPPVNKDTLMAAIEGTLTARRQSAVWQQPQVLRERYNHFLNVGEGVEKALAEEKESEYLATGKFKKILEASYGETDADALRRMRALLWIKQQRPSLSSDILAASEALFSQHPKADGLSAVRARIARDSMWSAVASVEQSAGLSLIQFEGWQPESEKQRVRKTFLPPTSKDEVIIPGHQQFRLTMVNPGKAKFRLDVGLDDIPVFASAAATVAYRVDKGAKKTIRLAGNGSRKSAYLSIPGGRHTLSIVNNTPISDQFVRIRVTEISGKSKGKSLIKKTERSFHVSTRQEPLVINMKGPKWLRVDRWKTDHVTSKYQLIGAGWHKLTFAPEAGENKSLFRVYERVLTTNEVVETPIRRPVVVHLDPVPEAPVRVASPVTEDTLQLHDAFELGDQEDGTWSIGLSGHRRRNSSQDRPVSRVSKFGQLELTHRFFDEPDHTYYETGVLGRLRQNSDRVLGLSERIYYNSPDWPVTFRLGGSLFVENFGGALNVPGVSNTEWSATLAGSVRQRRYITPKWYHVPSMSAFVRHVSINSVSRQLANGRIIQEAPAGLAGRIDTDVYTTYKSAHRFGLGAAETLAYRPWLDTLFRTRLGIRFNEKVVGKPDFVNFHATWDQRLGDAQLLFGYQFTHYFADDDRINSSQIPSLHAGLSWDIWQTNQSRWELGIAYRHFLRTPKDNTGFISLTWHFGEGRMYRDFQPGGSLVLPDFYNLRQRRIPQEMNNMVGAE